jgi:PAS domain S-box-containing protein
MATRRIYHRQFLDSGIPLTDKTLGFLPAHALSRISNDFTNWTKDNVYFNNVSDRPRNPKNAADAIEKEAIMYYRENPTEEERFVPFKSKEGESFYHFSAPIWIEEYCLKCHGKREDAHVTIRAKYDTSFDYKIGELRGVMSIKLPAAHMNSLVWSGFQRDLWIHLASFSGMFFLISWMLNRYVTTPVKRLTSGIEIVASGSYDQPITGLSGELDIVGKTFNQMSKQLGQREDELKTNYAEFRSVLSSLYEAAIIVFDRDGKIMSLWGTPEMDKRYGIRAVDIIGISIGEFVPPEHADQRLAEISTVFDAGEKKVVEYIINVPGGSFCHETSLSPLRDEEGNITAVVGFVRDITKRKIMEKELIKVQKLESVGVLAGGIAHDFNNYLQTILGYITLTEMHTNLDVETHKNLKNARKAIFQSTDLTRQLLTFSKGGEPVKETISISELIKNYVKLALSGSNVKRELCIPDNLWEVDADKGQLGQVFNNIIINACQAMSDGGNIKVCAENINVVERETSLLKKGEYVKITVCDNGKGISQEYLQKIFDPYFTTKQKGSGLGLATAYSIIKKHDGDIIVESTIGVGTTFSICLPASQKEIPKEFVLKEIDEFDDTSIEEKKGEKEGNTASKGKVLIMDDEYAIRDTLCKQLRVLKYDVEAVEEGSVAIRLYKKAGESGKPFDVVITDLTISGGMGGKETIKRLLEIDPEVKAVVMSGYANNPIMANYKDYGFKSVLTKPYKIHELDEILRRVIMEMR